MNTENTYNREIQEVTWEEVTENAKLLAQRITRAIANDCLPPISGIIAFSRGGLPLATMFAHALKIKTVYTTEGFETYFLDGTINPDHFLLVDDISDTGQTFLKFLYGDDGVKLRYGNQVKFTTVALFLRPDTAFIPDYAACNAKDKWLILPWEIEL